MWLLVGLGNPGIRYANTRHNIGFLFIDGLAVRYTIKLKETKHFISGVGAIGGVDIALLKPTTYMNLSGVAVKEALSKFSISTDQLLVVHDDLDIELGRIKVRKNGSSGGHRGIESIISELGTKDFIRLKIGIGRDSSIPSDEYVLGNFRPNEREIIDQSLQRGYDAIITVMTHGLDKAMSLFNRKEVVTSEK